MESIVTQCPWPLNASIIPSNRLTHFVCWRYCNAVGIGLQRLILHIPGNAACTSWVDRGWQRGNWLLLLSGFVLVWAPQQNASDTIPPLYSHLQSTTSHTWRMPSNTHWNHPQYDPTSVGALLYQEMDCTLYQIILYPSWCHLLHPSRWRSTYIGAFPWRHLFWELTGIQVSQLSRALSKLIFWTIHT